jgi:hypothetical protein
MVMVDFKALRKSESAFSLTEIALVMLGGMIILAAAVPAVNVALDQYRVVLAAQAITSQLHYTRMKAVSSNESFSVQFNAGSNSYDVRDGANAVIAGPFFLPRNISWNTSGGGDPVSFDSDFVTFLPTGNVPGTGPGSPVGLNPSVKIVSTRGVQIDIQVALGGIVRQSKPYTSGSPVF